MQPVYLFMLIFFLGSNCAQKNPDNQAESTLKSKVLASNLSYPWEILWGPDNMIWMTERNGRISKVNPTTGQVTPLITVADVRSRGEGGMLGMVLHPQFQANPYVFVAYNYENSSSGYTEKVVRFTYNGQTLTSPVTIFDNIDAAGIHNGCRLLIIDSKLYITTGDASNQSTPLNKNSVNGKVLRVNLDGTIPSDNPFPNSPVWSFGHRNAQGFVYANNILYSSEHGPSSDDEINIIEKGRNYGWPNVEGLCNDATERAYCNANNVKPPIYVWSPTEAVCGLDYYSGDLISEWKNSLLLCTLKGSKIIQLKLSADKKTITSGAEFFENDFGRLRDICVSPQGKVYVCTSNGNDKLVEISK